MVGQEQYTSTSRKRRARWGRRVFAMLALVGMSLATLVPTGAALAAEITFVSVVGSWRDPVDSLPGDQAGDHVITNGDPISSISWGTT